MGYTQQHQPGSTSPTNAACDAIFSDSQIDGLIKETLTTYLADTYGPNDDAHTVTIDSYTQDNVAQKVSQEVPASLIHQAHFYSDELENLRTAIKQNKALLGKKGKSWDEAKTLLASKEAPGGDGNVSDYINDAIRTGILCARGDRYYCIKVNPDTFMTKLTETLQAKIAQSASLGTP